MDRSDAAVRYRLRNAGVSAYRDRLVRKRALLLKVRAIIAFRPTRDGTQYRRRGHHHQCEWLREVPAWTRMAKPLTDPVNAGRVAAKKRGSESKSVRFPNILVPLWQSPH